MQHGARHRAGKQHVLQQWGGGGELATETISRELKYQR